MTLHRADPRTSERTRESIADTLGRSPHVEVIRVIEVRFLRGAGVTEADPVREVVALFREDGAPIVELDAFAGSDRADPPC